MSDCPCAECPRYPLARISAAEMKRAHSRCGEGLPESPRGVPWFYSLKLGVMTLFPAPMRGVGVETPYGEDGKVRPFAYVCRKYREEHGEL